MCGVKTCYKTQWKRQNQLPKETCARYFALNLFQNQALAGLFSPAGGGASDLWSRSCAGVDAGGVAREWVQSLVCVTILGAFYPYIITSSRLVSALLFNPDFALWSYSSINQMCMQINPSSGVANDEHLRYFHFTGRLLGKALFDRQIVAGHLVRPLYKVSVFALLFWTFSLAMC